MSMRENSMIRNFIMTFLLLTTGLMAERYALVIGVSNYKGDNKDLPGIKSDVKKMKKLLRNWHFEEKNIKVYSNKASLKLDSYLQAYTGKLSQDDLFVFYYSGHGAQVPDNNNEEQDYMDEVLVLSDGRRDIPYYDDDLNHRLSQIKAKKLVILDACHSGTANKDVSYGYKAKSILPSWDVTLLKFKGLFKKVESKKNSYLVLSASKDNETSIASKKGSLFTNQLVKLFDRSFQNRRKTLNEMLNEISYNIASECQAKRLDVYHPTFTAPHDNPKVLNQTIGRYFKGY